MHPIHRTPQVLGPPFTLADEGWESWQEPPSASAHSGLRPEEAPLWVLTTAECLQPMRRSGGALGALPGLLAQHSLPAVKLPPQANILSPLSSTLPVQPGARGGNKTSGVYDLPLQH